MKFANVIAVIALFVALSGGAYAAVKLKADSVGSRQVKDDSLGGRDVNESKLGEVPSAAAARNAGAVDGLDSTEIARRGLEWKVVAEAHQSGSPPGRFRCHHGDGVTCDVYFETIGGGQQEAAYARDDFGIVHLQGTVRFVSALPGPQNPGPLFTLPPGFRPAGDSTFASIRNGSELAVLDVDTNGEVSFEQDYDPGDQFSLNGFNFGCAPSGADGCP